jgi:hypothetical protein
MLSARDNYCPDQVTSSGAEPSHPTTIAECEVKGEEVDNKLFEAICNPKKDPTNANAESLQVSP